MRSLPFWLRMLLVLVLFVPALSIQAQTPTATPYCCKASWSYPAANTSFSSNTGGLAYDPSGPGTLYVGGVSVVQAVRARTGGLLGTLPGTFPNVTMMAMGQDGNLYVGTYDDYSIVKVQVPGGARAVTFDLSANDRVRSISVGKGTVNPDLYVGGDTGGVSRVVQPSTIIPLVFDPDVPEGRGSVGGLLFQDGQSGAPATLYLGASSANDVLQRFIQASAGSVTFGFDAYVTITGIIYPHQMLEDASGDVYVCGANGYVQYDADFQTQLKVCSSALFVVDPQGMAVDEEGNVFLGSPLDGALGRFGCIPANQTYQGFDPPAQGQAFIFPSPVRGTSASLGYWMGEPGNVRIKLWNSHGELSLETSAPAPFGTQVVPLDLSRLADGIYFFTVTLEYDSGRVEKLKPGKFLLDR